ncbi:hypothetical protein PG984_006992 [Apiospora sp. TS-2023a]
MARPSSSTTGRGGTAQGALMSSSEVETDSKLLGGDRADVVKLLVEAGAKVNCVSDTLMTPLDLVNGKIGNERMDRMRSYLVENSRVTAQRILHHRTNTGTDNPSSPSSKSPLLAGTAPDEPLYQPLNENEREIRLFTIEELDRRRMYPAVSWKHSLSMQRHPIMPCATSGSTLSV